MTTEEARRVILDNFSMNEGSLCLLLYDECVFSTEAFWDFYDAISVVTLADVKETALAAQISIAYQRFLKEIIFHFDPNDVAVMKGFPENYHSYIERLDYAVRAYLENKPDLLDDNLFDLHREHRRIVKNRLDNRTTFESIVCLNRKTTHEMKLHASPFEKIKSGAKSIELRLFDEKRQKIKAGDDIIFTNTDDGEKMCATVKKLHLFGSFEELYKSLPLLQCGYTAEDIAAAHPSDMEQYYSAEDQQKYGVVGIELFPLK